VKEIKEDNKILGMDEIQDLIEIIIKNNNA